MIYLFLAHARPGYTQQQALLVRSTQDQAVFNKVLEHADLLLQLAPSALPLTLKNRSLYTDANGVSLMCVDESEVVRWIAAGKPLNFDWAMMSSPEQQ